MKNYLAGIVVLSLLVVLALASPVINTGRGSRGRHYPWDTIGPWMQGNMSRHHRVMMYGIPEPYRDVHDPLASTGQILRHGAAIFADKCAACHGRSGLGNGAVNRELSPPPANLAWLAKMPISRSDPYMYWTIAEGGQAFGTDMPSFKRTLPNNDIWAVIAYVRAGMPTTTN